MQATPHADLIAALMDSRVPKTEREHAAAKEIERLRQLLLALVNHLETEWLPIQHYQNEWADDYPETFALLQRVREALGDSHD